MELYDYFLQSISDNPPEKPAVKELDAHDMAPGVEVPPLSAAASEIYYGKGVSDSADLRRILALPSRTRPSESRLLELAEEYKRRFGKPGVACNCVSTFKRRCCENLLPVQAWALNEIEQTGGLFGPIGVGHGKTLLDLLAPLVMQNCKIAVLLVPKQLREQLIKKDWEFYGQHWKLPDLAGGRWLTPGMPTLHVLSYSQLSSEKSSGILDRLGPDTIIADEGHTLGNRSSARTKRFLRRISLGGTRFIAWSGTLTRRSIRDYAHLCTIALRETAPTPSHFPTIEEWAGALDPAEIKNPPGALTQLCKPGETANEAYSRRLVETAGVVSSGDMSSCEASLVITERPLKLPHKIYLLLKDLDATAERPDGEQLVDAVQVAAAAKQLSCGFFYRWRWPRKEPVPVIERWLQVRKEWHKELREKLKTSRQDMDSPKLLMKAADRWLNGYTYIERDEHGEEKNRYKVEPRNNKGPLPTWQSQHWAQWKEVRPTAHPETEAVWIDPFMVEDAAAYLREGVGIAWYEFVDFGKALQQVSGCKRFGAGEEAGAGVLELSGTESAICSIRAHGTGKNLQQFSRALVANPPSGGADWEQLLGRHHRQGQISDQVDFEVYRHTQPFKDALDKARMLSEYIQGTFGASQKLINKATYMFKE